MPISNIVAVISRIRLTRGRTKVVKVAGGSRSVIVVIADCRACSGFVPAPGRVVAIAELKVCAVGISIIAQGEHCARDVIE